MSEAADPAAEVQRSLANRRTVIALSGGLDSVVLLHLALANELDIVAVHVDHGLRDDSSADAAFCARLARDRGIPFEAVEIDVAKGNSTQGRARRQRYAALVRAATRFGADCVATAHHADDAVESAWLQAARGAGPIGRAGPEPELDWWGVPIVRPLLDVSRPQLEEYASENGLRWREDPTNAGTEYERNRLRHEVLPDAIEPAEARASMPALRQEATERRAAVERLRRSEIRHPNFRRFSRMELASADREPLGRLFLDVAGELHGMLAGDLVDEIVAATRDDETESRRFTGSRVVVEVSADWVTLEATRGQGTRLLDRRRTVEISVQPGDRVPWFRRTIQIPEQPSGRLELRGPRPGERIQTSAGSRLLHDLLAEHGVPPCDRWWWPCLFDDGVCVAILDVARASR